MSTYVIKVGTRYVGSYREFVYDQKKALRFRDRPDGRSECFALGQEPPFNNISQTARKWATEHASTYNTALPARIVKLVVK